MTAYAKNKITKENVEVPTNEEFEPVSQTAQATAGKAFNYFDNTQYIPGSEIPLNKIFEVDTSKYTHMMLITVNRIDLLVLNKSAFPEGQVGMTKTPIVGDAYNIMSYAWDGDMLYISFSRGDLTSFCYMLAN